MGPGDVEVPLLHQQSDVASAGGRPISPARDEAASPIRVKLDAARRAGRRRRLAISGPPLILGLVLLLLTLVFMLVSNSLYARDYKRAMNYSFGVSIGALPGALALLFAITPTDTKLIRCTACLFAIVLFVGACSNLAGVVRYTPCAAMNTDTLEYQPAPCWCVREGAREGWRTHHPPCVRAGSTVRFSPTTHTHARARIVQLRHDIVGTPASGWRTGLSSQAFSSTSAGGKPTH